MPVPAHSWSLYILPEIHPFIHEKYPYNIISRECQAIYIGTEVIRTINDVRKPHVIPYFSDYKMHFFP